ncbi:hypothetical protein [Spirillospora sp. CA-128828]|uniref:hypothetical protein n=1 Tax=Spirillospora sp. CA-128828 TaxID=3240033 RepID=UPI003D8F00ED
MVLEGTVRGTGGLRITGDDCATIVPGLYAAGDVATRELVSGAVSGGGAYNGAWAISSGTWAGRGAPVFAAGRARPHAVPAGRAGLDPGRLDAATVIRAVQDEMLPLDRNLFRTRDKLRDSLASLDALWERITSQGIAGTGRERLRARSATAMTAHARWCYIAALARPESQGMHRLENLPPLRQYEHRRLVGGLDEPWTAAEPAAEPQETPA